MEKNKKLFISMEKIWGRRMRKEMFYRFFCRPLSLLLGGIGWFHLYSLCRFGRIRKNAPVIIICGIIFLILFIRFVCVCRRLRKKSMPFIYQEFSIKDESITLSLNDYKCSFLIKDIVYYRLDKKYCCMAAGRGQFFTVSCEGEEREYLKLKLSEVSLHRHCILKTPVLIGWVIISLIGGGLIVRSAMPYNGKLAWYIDEIRNTKSMVLVHDNIYEDKLSGVLEDIRQKVDLPQTLCLATGFSLHFKPDGTIVSLDVMLKGFDDEGNYTDSYLISYNRNHSNKIRVDLHGIANGVYEEEKDFNMLTEGMEAVPVKQTVSRWEEKEYGILYYGWREFSSYEDNIIYLSKEKEILDAQDTVYGYGTFGGYSISVYCPENSKIAPYRYLYLPKEQFQAVK